MADLTAYRVLGTIIFGGKQIRAGGYIEAQHERPNEPKYISLKDLARKRRDGILAPLEEQPEKPAFGSVVVNYDDIKKRVEEADELTVLTWLSQGIEDGLFSEESLLGLRNQIRPVKTLAYKAEFLKVLRRVGGDGDGAPGPD